MDRDLGQMERAGSNPRGQHQGLQRRAVADDSRDGRLDHTASGTFDQASDVLLPFLGRAARGEVFALIAIRLTQEAMAATRSAAFHGSASVASSPGAIGRLR